VKLKLENQKRKEKRNVQFKKSHYSGSRLIGSLWARPKVIPLTE
jgi:hypothetical protein